MPLEYEGTISEHLACRNSCAMFDVSHLGTVRLSDGEAADRVQNTLTNDLGKIEPGRAQYTHLLNTDGGVLDDIIVFKFPPELIAGPYPTSAGLSMVLKMCPDKTGWRAQSALRARMVPEGTTN